MLAKIGNWLTCLGFYSNFNSSTTCIGFGAKFCRNRIIDGTLQKFDTNVSNKIKLKIKYTANIYEVGIKAIRCVSFIIVDSSQIHDIHCGL